MRKFITAALLVASLSGFAQKDTTQPAAQDTAYVISKPIKMVIEALLRQNTQALNGKVLSFDETLQLIQQLNQAPVSIPKPEPKTQPIK